MRNKIAECLLIRDENHLLLEHLICNAIAGVERFYIYDNMSRVPVSVFLTENAPDLLQICTIERYAERDDLQRSCYADYLSSHRDDAEWTIFCDTDEIFEGNIKDAIKDLGDNYNCLSFSPILHGCNGHLQRPSGGTMQELYGDDILSRAHHWYKVCAKTQDIEREDVHTNSMKLKKMIYLSADNFPRCVLHHYRFRSFEDFLIKFQRGRANNNSLWIPRLKNFFDLNTNVSPNHPEVVTLMEKYGVTISTIQVHKDYYFEQICKN